MRHPVKDTTAAAVIRGRISFILLFFFIIFGALLGRFFIVQVLYYEEYSALAAKQHRLVKEVVPERGSIYARDKDGNLVPLALNKTFATIIASPREIENPESVSGIIAEFFNAERDAILEKLLDKDDPYEILVKMASPQKAAALETFGIRGIFFEEEKRRVYPHSILASHLLGFVSKEYEREEGRYGLERLYEETLMGRTGIFEGAKDASGFLIALARRIIHPSENGKSLVLTIDYNIQYKAEEVIEKAQEQWDASAVSVMVLDPSTGRILALAARPAFDPNEFSRIRDYSIFLNPLVETIYEPGSVIKPITIASAIEENILQPTTTYEDEGKVTIGGYTIRNFDNKAYGIQTMTEVLEKSLNTGAVYVSKLLGKNAQRMYLEKFGFGKTTGVDLPGELTGNLSHLDAGREIDFATASFGQGIPVTPIQLASALSALANGGVRMQPYIVESVVDETGTAIREHMPGSGERAVSRETAETVTKMLVSVVRNGPGYRRAGISGYFVAAKTGTAQIPRRDAPGYSDELVHSFAGYAPAFNPRFLILLKLDKPRGNRFAANTLPSAFHELAEFILNYYEIPPDER